MGPVEDGSIYRLRLSYWMNPGEAPGLVSLQDEPNRNGRAQQYQQDCLHGKAIRLGRLS